VMELPLSDLFDIGLSDDGELGGITEDWELAPVPVVAVEVEESLL